MAVNSELDELLSEPSSEEQVNTQQQTTTDPGKTRDENGRFVARQQEEKPAAGTEQASQTEPQQPAAEQPSGNGGIPVKAVQEEREKRQQAQQENEALRRELAELRGTVLAQRQQPQQKQEEKQPVTLWDDPDAFLQSQISPFQREMQQMREELWESRAIQVHGAEKVEAAKKAAEALFNTPEGRNLHQQITSSGNPFDNLVKWHQQQQTLSRIGNDPDAWLQAELERRLSDPAEQAKILERIRTGAASNTNNGKPITNLPPSLSRLPAGANTADDNDMSDGALFSHATR